MSSFTVYATELETLVNKYDGLLADLGKLKARQFVEMHLVASEMLQGDKLSTEQRAELVSLRELKKQATALGVSASAFDSRIDKLSGNKVLRAKDALKKHRDMHGSTNTRISNDTVMRFSFTKPSPAVFRVVFENSVTWRILTVNPVMRSVQVVLTSEMVMAKLPDGKTPKLSSASACKKLARVLLSDGFGDVIRQFASDAPFSGVNAGGLGGIQFLDTTATNWLTSTMLDETGKGTLPVEQIYKSENAK